MDWFHAKQTQKEMDRTTENCTRRLQIEWNIAVLRLGNKINELKCVVCKIVHAFSKFFIFRIR